MNNKHLEYKYEPNPSYPEFQQILNQRAFGSLTFREKVIKSSSRSPVDTQVTPPWEQCLMRLLLAIHNCSSILKIPLGLCALWCSGLGECQLINYHKIQLPKTLSTLCCQHFLTRRILRKKKTRL